MSSLKGRGEERLFEVKDGDRGKAAVAGDALPWEDVGRASKIRKMVMPTVENRLGPIRTEERRN